MKDLRLILIFASFLPIVWLVAFLCSLAIGVFTFGHLPAYGVDPDLHDLVSSFLTIVQLFVMTVGVGFFVVPAGFFIAVHLLINRVRVSRQELLLYVISAVSILLFLIFRFVWTAQFYWVYD